MVRSRSVSVRWDYDFESVQGEDEPMGFGMAREFLRGFRGQVILDGKTISLDFRQDSILSSSP